MQTKEKKDVVNINAKMEKVVNTENPEVETLKAEIEKLKSEIEKINLPESFEDKIKYFEKKKKLIDKRDKMTATIDNLINVFEEIRKEAEEDIFTSETFSIKLVKKSGYNNEQDLIKFRNPSIIAELVLFVTAKAEETLKALESEIRA